MSENKYIIDKDSLTGIADAVRNKLGNGEAITDEDAGYYPAPSLVGVKAPNITMVLDTGSPNAHDYGLNLDESPYESLYGNNPFSKIEIFGSYYPDGLDTYQVEMSINSTNCTMSYDSTKKIFSATCSFGSPQNTLLMRGGTNGFVSTSYSSSRGFYFSAMHFILKDANNNIIPPKLENLPVTWNPPSSSATRTVETGDMYYQEIMTPIPFTIDDIRNKIVNLSGGGLKIFKCYNKSSIRNSEGDGWKVSNYLGTSAYYNLNFSSTSPYITTQVPDLNPENIIFICYIGSKQSSGYTYTRSFIFDPTLKDVEHYTSASSSNGKRLSSTTDYYFFPDGAGSWYTSNDYGIMGMWDANNKILDLGLQKVSSRSGTYVASNYTSQYYNIPVSLVIVYKT